MTEEELKSLNDIYNNYKYNGEKSYIDLSIVDNFKELLFIFDEKMMSMEISIMLEIDDLLKKGKSKEEIFNMIIDSPFNNELTNEEIFYLKKSSIKILEIRYELHLQEKVKQKKLK